MGDVEKLPHSIQHSHSTTLISRLSFLWLRYEYQPHPTIWWTTSFKLHSATLCVYVGQIHPVCCFTLLHTPYLRSEGSNLFITIFILPDYFTLLPPSFPLFPHSSFISFSPLLPLSPTISTSLTYPPCTFTPLSLPVPSPLLPSPSLPHPPSPSLSLYPHWQDCTKNSFAASRVLLLAQKNYQYDSSLEINYIDFLAAALCK